MRMRSRVMGPAWPLRPVWEIKIRRAPEALGLVRNGGKPRFPKVLAPLSFKSDDIQSDSGGVMGGAEAILAVGDFVMREAALFAACGFLLLGLSDLAVDLLWIGTRLTARRGARPLSRSGRPAASPSSCRPGTRRGDRRDVAMRKPLSAPRTISSMSAVTRTIRRRSRRSAPPPGPGSAWWSVPRRGRPARPIV